MPGNPQLIQAVYFEAPLCPSGTGEAMADAITEVADKWINKSQYQGGQYDGVYFHCGVDRRLDSYYGREGVNEWDAMHNAARVGTAMRDVKRNPGFVWLDLLSDTMSKGNQFINFGAVWHELNEIFRQRKADGSVEGNSLKTPKFSPDHRYENHIYICYFEFRERFSLLLEVMESFKEKYQRGESSERSKAVTAEQISGRMFNTLFALSLSGMCDIYHCYSSGIKILQVSVTNNLCSLFRRNLSNFFQTIDLLPTEKYNKFRQLTVECYLEMKKTIKMADCPCSIFRCRESNQGEVQEDDADEEELKKAICMWPFLHADEEELLEKGTYRGVPMGTLVEDTFRTRHGTSQRARNLELNLDDILEVEIIFSLHIVYLLQKDLYSCFSQDP